MCTTYPSTSSGTTHLDNAIAESFVSTLEKAELIGRLEFPTRRAARTAMFEYLETFYNARRLHSFPGYKSPVNFEEDRLEETRGA